MGLSDDGVKQGKVRKRMQWKRGLGGKAEVAKGQGCGGGEGGGAGSVGGREVKLRGLV